jgi:CRP/FNR family transcriptional regulator, cyclic AMP receptor protein
MIVARLTIHGQMKTSPPRWVGNAHWTRSLADEELERAIAGTVEKLVPANAYVCRKGEVVEHWIGVVDGLVKISNYSFEGKAMTFSGIPSGGWFGEGSLLKKEIRRYDGVALQESTIAYMQRKTFQWLLDHSIGFNRFLLIQLNERLGQAFSTIESHSLLSPDGRVARCLAGLFNPVLHPGFGSQLRVSQEELGYLTNLSRQRVNRALKTLEGRCLLKAGYGRIEVIDLEGLRRFVA